MISVVANIVAFFLLGAALYLAYHAGSFRREFKNTKNPPPVVVFSIVVAFAAYLIMVLI